MHAFLSIIGIGLFLWPPAGISDPVQDDPEKDWVLRKEQNGVIIYTREEASSNLKEYRVTAIIESPLTSVYELLTDLAIRPEWVINCASVTIIDSLGKDDYVFHTVYDLPWPLPDRDLVVRSTHQIAGDGKRASLLAVFSERDWPLEKGRVRMTQYRESTTLEWLDAGRTRFYVEGFADPGGSLPAWVINLFLVDGIYDSMIRTREMAEKR